MSEASSWTPFSGCFDDFAAFYPYSGHSALISGLHCVQGPVPTSTRLTSYFPAEFPKQRYCFALQNGCYYHHCRHLNTTTRAVQFSSTRCAVFEVFAKRYSVPVPATPSKSLPRVSFLFSVKLRLNYKTPTSAFRVNLCSV